MVLTTHLLTSLTILSTFVSANLTERATFEDVKASSLVSRQISVGGSVGLGLSGGLGSIAALPIGVANGILCGVLGLGLFGGCRQSCPAGYQPTNQGICVDILQDPRNCGAIGNTCNYYQNAQSFCTGGQCSASCLPGFSFDPSTGTCTAGSSITNCNGRTCLVSPNANTQCINNSCVQTCLPDFQPQPPSPDRIGGGLICVQRSSNDPRNCAFPGNVCNPINNGYPTCLSNTCGFACNFGFSYSLATGQCVQNGSNTDVNNCGSAGNKCPVYPNSYSYCSNGQCGAGCNAGYYYNVQTQLCTLNGGGGGCGSCPTDPFGTPTCSPGSTNCSIKCNPGFLLASNQKVCVYTSTLIDPNNCGKVGTVCPGVSVCVGGQCKNTQCFTRSKRSHSSHHQSFW